MPKSHQFWLSRCIEIAERGRGKVSPNPMVGSCVVKNGKLISEGYHSVFGGPHAEVIALKKAGARAKGATIYVSLEPCSTYGKTAPCTEAILKSGAKEVVIASLDPNPRNFKKGISVLRKLGVKVRFGILADKVAKQNEAFFTYQTEKRPFVILKMAESLDGKITTFKHSREWISGLPAREWTHGLREAVDAVIVGTNTITVDNPRMTPYLSKSKNPKLPVRVVLDRELKLPKDIHVFGKDAETIVLTSKKHSVKKIAAYATARRITVLPVKEKNKSLDVKEILKALYRLGISSLMIEGGGELNASFLDAKAVDKVYMFVAPFILGGRTTVSSVEGRGIASVKDAIRLRDVKSSKIGEDFLIEGYVK